MVARSWAEIESLIEPLARKCRNRVELVEMLSDVKGESVSLEAFRSALRRLRTNGLKLPSLHLLYAQDLETSLVDIEENAPLEWDHLGAEKFVALARQSKDVSDFAKRLSKMMRKTISASALTTAAKRWREKGHKFPQLRLLYNTSPDPENPNDDYVDIDEPPPTLLEKHRLQAQIRDLKGNTKSLLKQLDLAERKTEIALSISDPDSDLVIEPYKNKTTREACALVLASDWHIEEKVDPKTVLGLNKFNPHVAEDRAKAFFRGVAWKINHHQDKRSTGEGYDIKRLILWAGGDKITGFLHEDNLKSNYMTPLEAILFYQRLWISGINFLLEETDIEKIDVVASHGNHGRTTRKTNYNTSAKENYEWLAHHSIAMNFESSDRVSYVVSSGRQIYAQVYDWSVRFVHGDDIGYGGGIGTIAVPVHKAVHKWDQTRHADLTVMGHWHQMVDYGHIVVNGSLIGFNPYALSKKIPYQPPQQTFILIDKERGKTAVEAIWVDEQSKMPSKSIMEKLALLYEHDQEPEAWEETGGSY